MPQSPHWLQRDAPHLPQNCPFPFDTHLIHLSLDNRPHSHPKQHPDPISRFATVHFPDRQKDRPTDTRIGKKRVPNLLTLYWLYSDEANKKETGSEG